MGFMHIENLYKKNQEILLFKQVYALEKIHGCLQADTRILTEDGIKTIREVCESKYSGKVLSYDPKTKKVCFKSLSGVSIGDETDDWFEVILSNGETIVATSNHRFWIESLQCWRQLSDLKEGDVLTIL